MASIHVGGGVRSSSVNFGVVLHMFVASVMFSFILFYAGLLCFHSARDVIWF